MNNIKNLEGEIWKDIKGFEGFYQASNLGRIKSSEWKVWGGKSFYLKKGRILKQSKNQNGYMKIEFMVESVLTRHKVHRLVLSAFIPNPENKYAVNHKNGIKHDNRLENLEWCNKSENMKHAYEMGLIERAGDRVKCHLKLTDEHVIEIRTRFTPFVLTSSMLAKEYCVSKSTIEGLLFNKNKRPHLKTRKELQEK